MSCANAPLSVGVITTAAGTTTAGTTLHIGVCGSEKSTGRPTADSDVNRWDGKGTTVEVRVASHQDNESEQASMATQLPFMGSKYRKSRCGSRYSRVLGSAEKPLVCVKRGGGDMMRQSTRCWADQPVQKIMHSSQYGTGSHLEHVGSSNVPRGSGGAWGKRGGRGEVEGADACGFDTLIPAARRPSRVR